MISDYRSRSQNTTSNMSSCSTSLRITNGKGSLDTNASNHNIDHKQFSNHLLSFLKGIRNYDKNANEIKKQNNNHHKDKITYILFLQCFYKEYGKVLSNYNNISYYDCQKKYSNFSSE